MNNVEKMFEMLSVIIEFCRNNNKLCQSLVEYISDNSLATDMKIEKISAQIEEVKKDVQNLDKLKAESIHVYTDEELYKLKKLHSWKELSRKTHIPLSTLQYHVRRYMSQNREV